MARATLEMFLKVVGVDKASRELGKVSKVTNDLDKKVKNTAKANAKFASGMSGLHKTAIAGAALFAGKALFDFSKEALNAAVVADEAAAAFGTTFGEAAQDVNNFLEEFANKAGLTVSEAQQLTAVMGSVAQGLGMTQREAASLSIEITKISADIASFMNVSGGAEQVMRAMQSALVGEFESMKTYGAVLSAVEVQQVAMNQTGKETVDQLTRLDKAWATLTLIQDKAKVQIGDLDRTFMSFANQSRAVGAEIRQLKEDIGRELIPAAEAMLPLFRDFVDDVAPKVIAGFSNIGEALVDLALASQFAERTSHKLFGILETSGHFGDQRIRTWKEMADEQRKYNAINDRTIDKQTLSNIQTNIANKELNRQRSLWQVILPQTRKYGKSLEKDINPQVKKLALFLGFANKEVEKIAKLTEERADAQKDFNRTAEKEALVTAEEVLRKKELQKEIQELLFFQNKGVDVAAELAVKQEELKLVELELTRESEALIDARDRLIDSEKALQNATDRTSESFADQIARKGELQQALNDFTVPGFLNETKLIADALNLDVNDAIKNVMETYKGMIGEIEGKPFPDILAESYGGLGGLGQPGSVSVAAPPLDTGGMGSGSGFGRQSVDINVNVRADEGTAAEISQEEQRIGVSRFNIGSRLNID
tara:strand:- start:1971 stop:3935 length:1965 start_codon:yes stop_codon:yes gene_type:complete